jgi:hypothetical protein
MIPTKVLLWVLIIFSNPVSAANDVTGFEFDGTG